MGGLLPRILIAPWTVWDNKIWNCPQRNGVNDNLIKALKVHVYIGKVRIWYGSLIDDFRCQVAVIDGLARMKVVTLNADTIEFQIVIFGDGIALPAFNVACLLRQTFSSKFTMNLA